MQPLNLQSIRLPNDSFEQSARQRHYRAIAGVDEAGRGPIAGPVVAAACILPDYLEIEGINDSKQLTPAQRHRLFETMNHHSSISFGIGIIDALRIDQINILQATFEAMVQAVNDLRQRHIVDYLLVDGSLLAPSFDLPAEAIISGDQYSLSIAAASIIAKETRDRLMKQYHLQWPQYNFQQHKGYPTQEHLAQVAIHGPSPIHRRSFSPFREIR